MDTNSGVLVLPIARNSGNVDIVIVVSKRSLERMEEHDPVVVPWDKMPDFYLALPVHNICVAFATVEEFEKIQTLSRERKLKEILELLHSGFKYRPEEGDTDEVHFERVEKPK